MGHSPLLSLSWVTLFLSPTFCCTTHTQSTKTHFEGHRIVVDALWKRLRQKGVWFYIFEDPPPLPPPLGWPVFWKKRKKPKEIMKTHNKQFLFWLLINCRPNLMPWSTFRSLSLLLLLLLLLLLSLLLRYLDNSPTMSMRPSNSVLGEALIVIFQNVFQTLPEAQRTQKLTPRLGLNLATTWRHLH